MRALAILFFVILFTPAIAQDAISTGLENPCREELQKWFPPAAVMDVRRLPKAPKTASLEKYLPAIGDQGKQGSCTAFSVASALTIIENRLKNKTYKIEVLDFPRDLYSPAFIFNVGKAQYPIPRRTNCRDGISYIDAFSVVQNYGIVSMNEFGYNAAGTAGCTAFYYPPDKIKKNALKRRVFTFQRPQHYPEVFKYWLSRENPCPINIAVKIDKNYKAACDPAGDYTWKEEGQPIANQENIFHAMLIVGYDDDRQCFRVLDSRGRKNGDKGFLWLSYGLLAARVIYDAYVCCFDDEILKDARAQNSGEGDVDIEENHTESSWVKEGYFRTFNGVKFVCTKIDKKNDTVTFFIKDRFSNALLIDSALRLRIGTEIPLQVNNKTLSLKIKEWGREGNPFRPSVRFDITLAGERVNEQYEEGKDWVQISDAFRECYGELQDMTYAGFSNTTGLGTIFDVRNNNMMAVASLEESDIEQIKAPGYRHTCTVSSNSAFEYSIFFPIRDSIKNLIDAASRVDMKFDMITDQIALAGVTEKIKSTEIERYLTTSFGRKTKFKVVSKVLRVSNVEATFFIDTKKNIKINSGTLAPVVGHSFTISRDQQNTVTIRSPMDVILFFKALDLNLE